MQDNGNPAWWEAAKAGRCSHGGHGWDGEACDDASRLTWAEMHPAEFDATLATAAERRLIREAPDTLFPRLMPEPRRPAAAPGTAELAGQDDLFGGAL
jgi:hypothetical protein